MANGKSKKKSTVKIVGATDTVHSPEYCYSLCGYNSIAPFGKKFNRNREKIGFTANFLISISAIIFFKKGA